ncbi:uncharacterized protein LOC116161365 isoform X2 [Photinus pyralis]|nr:uncharacterized protein LOC116159175 isoform X2 [Photinus pyralis]XP_031329532.1 uncharacterized protein LOC116160476 isoform X2 [Photinus pyralis]XP_031329538.1 uncharacterized protein LOC116160481 isoform X2 [Photinus pyralis]XP_031329553.1 uncharacterized protein LOC116160490 isoform X2 [Photinus pyralis]XP_031330660.1 uncharacterized protein LOC116161365 isoform X2 [Photinus pyralis]
MPNFCAVAQCGSRSNRDKVSFFRFPSIYDNNKKVDPRKERRREAWILATRRTDLTDSKLKYQMICSRHFLEGKPAKLSDENHPDWIPSQNMGYDKRKASMERYNRSKKRIKQESIQEPLLNMEIATHSAEVFDNLTSTLETTECTNVTEKDLEYGLLKANEEIYRLRKELSVHKFSMSDMKDDAKCKFYTGLSFEVLEIVFQLVEPYIMITPNTTLSKFEQVILTLMKLRLNLLFTDLGYRFNISRSTCGRIFKNVLHVLYKKLRSFVQWPERECLCATMPKCFKENFGNRVTVIIDCFEIFTEKPKNKEASSQHFSHYKHHHTIKYFIGISPQGSVMFISKAFTGRSSDKFITENSGFLKNLLPGDLILADRGFLIKDSVNLCMAEVQMPAFLKGKKQLHPKEVEDTRKLANVRIHVERVIGLLRRKYKITSNTLPMFMVRSKYKKIQTIDKILTVSCALINFCPSIVPQ